ncbi:TrpR-binding protein WrbA [Actinoplanes italicus]|uniref:NAD(P)H dehydrogenase (Quinone) n=1 Tax=Actinoplanes italicus TaxID=113567 RepID=A0A2T0JUW9_9ACTN|nr:NAD(P)H-dependent oxidoreductase [Actinoplanes italicus]PRX11439.1 NAD(P)H dehydrogenase (quinone) [Actinoplanes italicus]GIE34034.1 TrpR-binding protein WrbA [Actinoplanes italicus]
MTNLAVVYYSGTGNVHRLAVAAAEAAEKTGASVRLRRIPELVDGSPAPSMTEWTEAWSENTAAIGDVELASPDDLDWADAVLWGTPGRFGLLAAPLKHFIEQAWPLHARNGLLNKVMSSFTSTGAAHGGQESTILSLNNVFYHWGAIIVPPGVADPVQLAPSNGNPYGVSSVSGPKAVPGRLAENVTDDNLAAIGYQAQRMVEIAAALRHGLTATSPR